MMADLAMTEALSSSGRTPERWAVASACVVAKTIIVIGRHTTLKTAKRDTSARMSSTTNIMMVWSMKWSGSMMADLAMTEALSSSGRTPERWAVASACVVAKTIIVIGRHTTLKTAKRDTSARMSSTTNIMMVWSMKWSGSMMADLAMTEALSSSGKSLPTGLNRILAQHWILVTTAASAQASRKGVLPPRLSVVGMMRV